MTLEQIRKATADVMEFRTEIEWNDECGRMVKRLYRPDGKGWYGEHAWHPDLDRNQSRMVVQQALGGPDDDLTYGVMLQEMHRIRSGEGEQMDHWTDAWIYMTARDECEAVLRALGKWATP